MVNNLTTFIKLKQDYEAIIVELKAKEDEPIIGSKFLAVRTGFGETSTCTLCQTAIRLRDAYKGICFCKYCIWSNDSVDGITTAPCVGKNYGAIHTATSTHKLATLLTKRVQMMQILIDKYNGE